MNTTRVTEVSPELRPRLTATMERNLTSGPGGCIEWTGWLDKYGYGVFRFRTADGRRKMTGAHRMAWLLRRGPIGDGGLVVDHLCRNRRCCNPEHLELVSNQDNIRRGAIVNREMREPRTRLVRPPKTVCGSGHLLEGENLRVVKRKDGYTVRLCVQCCRERSTLWRRAQGMLPRQRIGG